MSVKYYLNTTHSFDGENDVDLLITFSYSPGSPERGPTWSCGGEPAEDPEVDFLDIVVDGRKATDDEFAQAQESNSLWEKCVKHAEDARQKGRDD